jgi:hypothetical protein
MSKTNQEIECKNVFKSKDEKQRKQNFIEKWASIIKRLQNK